MRAGTVIKWNDFPEPRFDNEIKSRWFICLGRSGILMEPIHIYLCTTTTNFDNFQQGGKRADHKTYFFKSDTSPFDEDCVLDIDEGSYSITESKINNENIEVKGELDEKDLRVIFKLICQSERFSYKIKLDIHTSLNNIEITGLKKPKKTK